MDHVIPDSHYPYYYLKLADPYLGGYGGGEMISVWAVVGLLLLSVCSGVATAVVMILLGVQGVMVALTKRLETVEISQENLDRRLTTEVKARAAGKAVEARTEAKSLLEVASHRLLEEQRPAAPWRPSVVGLIRR